MKSNKKTPYVPKYNSGGIFNLTNGDKKKINKAGKQIGTAAYGIGEGLLDTVTMGATDQITDKGYYALQKAGNSTQDEMREQDSIRGFSNAAGAIGGAVINPAATGTAISQTGKGLGAGVSKGNESKDWAQGAGMALNTAGQIGAMAYGQAGSPMSSGMQSQAANFNASSFGQGLGKYNQFMNQGGGNEYMNMLQPFMQQQFAMGGMQYANGGTGQINSEVEKQENAMTPNGQFTQFNGPSHSNGGIKTDMAPGTMIFSDKLKAPGTNKTFAKLNAGNNTNREDKLFAKGNLDPKSEASLKLTMMAKTKNSDMLFAMQEQLKKDKVAAYAKKMGVQMPSMDNEQMEPQGLPEQAEGEYKHGGMYPMGGVKLPMYPNGTRVTLSKPDYEQAQRDSLTLNRSGIKYPTIGQQGTDAEVHSAYNRLDKMGAARPISGQFNQSYAGYDPSHPSVKFAKPTMVPYNEDNFTVNEEPQQVRKPATFNIAAPKTFEYINDPKYGTYQEQWNRQFPQKAYGGYMNKYPDGGTIPPQRFTYRALGIEPTRMTPMAEEDVRMMSRPNNFNYKNLDVERVRMQQPFNYRNLEVEPTRMSELPDEEVAMMSRPNPILAQRPDIKYSSGLKVYPKLSYGGTLPKYANGFKIPGVSSTINFSKPNSNFLTTGQLDKTNPLSRVASNVENNDTLPAQIEPYGYTGTSYADEQTKLANTGTTEDDTTEDDTTPPPSPQGFNWKNAAGQVGIGLLQNAGNLYNLSRYNKPEVEKYERMQVEKVDPTAAIRDAKLQKKAAEYNLKQGGGSAAAYMSNILGLTSLNIQDIDRVRQQYGNINAEIQNRANQYNTQLAMQEVIANAQNRARTRSGKGEAIAGIGQNVSQQMLDSKKGKMDEKTLAMYQSYFNNPQFKAAMKKAGYDLG